MGAGTFSTSRARRGPRLRVNHRGPDRFLTDPACGTKHSASTVDSAQAATSYWDPRGRTARRTHGRRWRAAGLLRGRRIAPRLGQRDSRIFACCQYAVAAWAPAGAHSATADYAASAPTTSDGAAAPGAIAAGGRRAAPEWLPHPTHDGRRAPSAAGQPATLTPD